MKRVIVPLGEEVEGRIGKSYVFHPYLDKLQERGILPVLIPAALDPNLRRELMAGCQGVLLMGGADIDPTMYGETKHATTEPGPHARDQFELELVCWAVRERLPILAICRGAQMLNVAFGGTLVQHVPDVTAERHRAGPEADYRACLEGNHHDVALEPDSKVAAILGGVSVQMNSAHHQSVGRIGRGLRVVGKSPEGLVEFIEHATNPFCIGCQAHPEAMAGVTDRLWDAFAAAL